MQPPHPQTTTRADRSAHYIAAFDEAVEALRAMRRRRKSKYVFADPQAPDASSRGYPLAAGIPVLLCDAAAGVWEQGRAGGDQRGGGVRLPPAPRVEAHAPPQAILTGVSCAMQSLRSLCSARSGSLVPSMRLHDDDGGGAGLGASSSQPPEHTAPRGAVDLAARV